LADKTFKLAIIAEAVTDSATKGLGALGKTLGGIGLAAGTLGTAVAGGAVVAGGALLKLAIDAAPLEGIEDAFEGITAASGESGEVMLAALQKGSQGLITQRDLMQKYNLAASLVSDQFANQLPEAMGYLSKVAAGTGEDMGFMMDSMVRGIGRLSPMILDNLGIQVSLSEAYDAFAPTIGKVASELTKQEQQTALTAQVMEKLAENTAAMPEVAGTAATSFGQLTTQVKDLKDRVGQALLPILLALITPLNDLAAEYGPKVIEWAKLAGQWLGDKLPVAINTLKSLWLTYWPVARDTLVGFWNAIRPALEWVRDILTKFAIEYLPRLQNAWNTWRTGLDAIVELYNTQLKPALQDLWTALQPLWETMGIGEGVSGDLSGAIGKFTGFMAELYASGIIEGIKVAIQGLVVVVKALVAIYELGVHWGIRVRDVIHSMVGVFDNIRHHISVVVDAFRNFRDSLAGFSLPWWLTPGSPTPLETGLTGIANALLDVQGLSRSGISFGRMSLAGAGGGITNINIVNRFGPDSVRSDKDILNIADEIAHNLELRGIGPAL